VAAKGERRRTPYRRRLRSRIIVSFVLLGFCLTTLFAFATNWARMRVENQLVEDVINHNIEEYARRFYEHPGRNPAVPVQQIRAYAYSADKFDKARESWPQWADLQNGNYNLSGTDEQGQPYAYKLAVRKADDAWFFLAYDMTDSVRGGKQLNRALVLSVLVFSVLSLVLGWWSASKVMKPVSDLAARLRAYRGGTSEPEPLAPRFPDDEVGQLAQALDDYSSRLTEVVQRDREFNADVSHELRTPLTVIRVASDMALGDESLQPRLRRSLQRIQRAGRDMEAVIDAFLILAREADVEPQIELFDVNDIVRYEVDNANELLGARPVSVHLHSDGPVQLHAPPRVLQVVVSNLVRNACSYTDEGRIDVHVHNDRVVVHDTGIGMSPEALSRAFEPFYRAEPSRPQGTGLGLSIVRRLCDRFGWKVSLASEPGQGTEATVIFR